VTMQLIHADSIDLADGPEAKVLRLDDVAARARGMIDDARRQAEVIGAEAHQAALVRRDAAAEEGYAEGFARGQAEGYAEAAEKARAEADRSVRDELDALADEARRIVRQLADAREQVVAEASQQMLEFSLALAGKVVGRVAANDPAAARANLAKALQLASEGASVLARVNPAQLADLQAHSERFAAALGDDGRVCLVADEDINPGGVVVSTAHGEIDATIETQLANVAASVLGTEQGGGGRGRP